MLDMRDMGQSSKVSLFWSGQQAHDAAKKKQAHDSRIAD
jgi:hypothetical protein